MNRKNADYSGLKFGKWTVLHFKEVRYEKVNLWLCQCECGTERAITISELRHGLTNSCSACAPNPNFQHGLSRSPTYRSWCGLKERCLNTDCNAYASYGGRGIRVCSFISASVENLISLIATRPEGRGLSIDRTNNNGHYSCGACPECRAKNWPFNVRWASPKQQARNRRNNSYVTVHGVTITQSELAERSGIDVSVINARVSLGWKGDSLIRPVMEMRKRVK